MFALESISKHLLIFLKHSSKQSEPNSDLKPEPTSRELANHHDSDSIDSLSLIVSRLMGQVVVVWKWWNCSKEIDNNRNLLICCDFQGNKFGQFSVSFVAQVGQARGINI